MNRMTGNNQAAAPGLRLASIPVICLLMLWAFLHAGCAVWPVPTRSMHVGASGPMGSCADFFAALDEQTASADAFDSGYTRVRQFPYLRADRFTASFRDAVDDPLAFAAWVDRLQALDQAARQIEIANLPDAAVAAMDGGGGRDSLIRRVAACGDRLKTVDLMDAGDRAQLQKEVMAKDDYIPLRRILGLYSFTRMFVLRGVNKWHAEAEERFALEPPADWQPIRYAPPEIPDPWVARRIIQGAATDVLGIPSFTTADRKRLFQAFAPTWEIQAQSDNDRFGSPIWKVDGRIGVATDRPQTYTHLSFTRFGEAILTQLNYIIWFPSRPKVGVLDIYGGLLDGLNYRVTLDANGEPLLYETMHNCGCYYKAYPTRRLQVREAVAYAEPPLILNSPEIEPASETMVVGMESRTHYIRYLYPLPRSAQLTATAYTLVDYDELKRLPHANGHRRSMFNRYGIVTGSERLERFILWPSGVLSPGAMRQWGRHAVAFVGQRHFDDPFYMDHMFVPADL